MRHALTRRLAVGVFVVGLTTLMGCGDGLQYAEVEGTVTQNGKPLEKVLVEFHPDGPGPKSAGVTDANGKYVLQTDSGSRSGAVVGSFRVVLRDRAGFPDQLPPRSEMEKDHFKGKKVRLRAEYGDPAKTPLKQTVKAGDKNVIDLDAK